MAYVPQSGGGRAPNFDTSAGYILSKPYELGGDPNAATLQYLNEMLEELYKATNRVIAQVAANTLSISDMLTQIAIINAQILIIQGQITILQGSIIGSSVWTLVTTPLSAADLMTLFSTPKTLLAAPGVGFANIIHDIVIAVTYPATFTGAGGYGDFYIRWSGTAALNIVTVTNDLNNARNKLWRIVELTVTAVGANTTGINNSPIIIGGSGGGGADFTAGGAGASGIVSFAYRTVTCPA